MMATNFEEYVFKMAEESPHAVVLDWYRRLELMIRSYLKSRAIHCRSGYAAELVIAGDVMLGSDVATAIANLRRVRNGVAHTGDCVSFDTAVAFARDSFSFIGALLQAQDANASS
jgi:hypothetical protein